MKRAHYTLILLLMAVGCSPNITETDFYSRHPEDVEEPGQTELATLGDPGHSLRLLVEDGLHFGYNSIHLESRQGSEPAKAVVTIRPRLLTPDGAITSPFDPEETTTDESGGGELGVYLLEPAGTGGRWQLEVSYVLGTSSETEVIDVEVAADIWVQRLADSDVYATWMQPTHPSIGREAFEVTLHAFDGSAFSPVRTATIDLFPYMDMGGGDGHSTPFEAPIHLDDGLYRGEVNFIMSGGWDMTLYVSRNGALPDTILFAGFTVD